MLHRVITWKLLLDGEEIKLLIVKDLNLLRGVFWWERWVNFWLLLRIFPIPRVSHKGSGERGTVHTWGVHQFFDIFVKKGDTWHIILWDNPAGHCFFNKGFLIELFQISQSNWMYAAAKSFVETLLKAIRDTFFSQYVIFLFDRRGKFKLLRLQGNPYPPTFPSSHN